MPPVPYSTCSPIVGSQRNKNCREKGVYPEQIRQWREACEQANDWDRTHNQRLQETRREDEKRIRDA